MRLDRYELAASRKLTTFEFVSVGPKGRIPKLIQYDATNLAHVFNLSFGDKNAETGEIDDSTVSNNGDSEQVLATVVATVYAYTDKYPDRWIHATGSTKARTRLYRMGITKYYEEAINDFDIFGRINEDWEEFMLGVNYDAFVVRRKSK